MFKKIKDLKNSLNGIPFERGKKPIKWKKRSCHKLLSPLILEKHRGDISSPPLLARLLPNLPFTTNKNPACFLNYLQMPREFSAFIPKSLFATNPRPHTKNTKSREKLTWSLRPCSAYRAIAFQKRAYSSKTPAQSTVEAKRSNKLVNDEEYIKSLKKNIQGLLEKQMDQIKELQTKRVKKDISCATGLQKMVIDRIREGNRPDTFFKQKSEMPEFNNKLEAKSKINITNTKSLHEKFGRISKNTVETNAPVANLNRSQNYMDYLKTKHSKLTSYEKNTGVQLKNEETVSSSLKASHIDRCTSLPSVKKFPKKHFQAKLVEIKEEKADFLHQRNLTSEITLPLKGKTEQYKDEKRNPLKHIQFSDPGNLNKYQTNHEQKGVIKSNETAVNVLQPLNPNVLPRPFPIPKRKPYFLRKEEMRQDRENALDKALEGIANRREKQMFIRKSKEELTPRNRNPRQLPNLVRNNKLGFSHKAVFLKDSDLYRKFRTMEREKRMRTIYNSHWTYSMPRDVSQPMANLVRPNIGKAIVKPTSTAIVHKLNASSIAEKIRQKAKIINENKLRDEHLQPQVYCKKSIALGLAQMPIMPCKNVLQKDEAFELLKKKRPIFLRTTPQNVSRANKLYTQSLKNSRPIWANQKMITSNLGPSGFESKSPNSRRKKIDFKGTLKYIMSLKSRLQGQ